MADELLLFFSLGLIAGMLFFYIISPSLSGDGLDLAQIICDEASPTNETWTYKELTTENGEVQSVTCTKEEIKSFDGIIIKVN